MNDLAAMGLGGMDPTVWLLVFARTSALLGSFPIFSAKHLPVRLRIALCAILAFLLLPTVPPLPQPPSTMFSLLGLMVMEVVVGLLLGFVTRLVFFVLDFAGALIAMEMGLNMASDINPWTQARNEVPGLILYYLAAMLFFTLDLHHWLLVGLQRTFEVLPLGGAHLHETLLTDVLARIAQVFMVSVQMAAPCLAIAFLITLVLAIFGRAVPQMSVFSESFVFRTISGLAVFGLTLNLMAQHILNYLRRLPEDMLRIAELLT